jgi:hypothetical protein
LAPPFAARPNPVDPAPPFGRENPFAVLINTSKEKIDLTITQPVIPGQQYALFVYSNNVEMWDVESRKTSSRRREFGQRNGARSGHLTVIYRYQ